MTDPLPADRPSADRPSADQPAADQPDPGPRTERRRDRWRASDDVARGALLVSLLVVFLLVMGLIAAGSRDGRPHAEAGELFLAAGDDPLPDLGRVLLPWVPLDVGVGEPVPELPDLAGGQANLRAPVSGSFVRVDVDLDLDHLTPVVVTSASRQEETDLVLRADGRDYPLDGSGGLVVDPEASYTQGGTVWVAVPGTPSDLEVLVTVDGVTQTVASDGTVDAGDAAALADLPSQEELQAIEERPCGPPERLDDTDLRLAYDDRLSCRLDLAVRTPFVDGLGWAEPGREFLMVQLVTDEPSYLDLVTGTGKDVDYWDASGPGLRAELGGEGPLSEARANDLNQSALALADPDDPTQLVFDVPADGDPGDLRLTLVLRATVGEPFVTDRATFRARWTLPAEDLA